MSDFKALRELIRSIALDFNDFEPRTGPSSSDGADLAGLLGRKVPAEAFDVLGSHGSGSLIALWRPSEEVPWERAPAVWIDSEGDPCEVFAASLADALSLLALNMGTLYDAMRAVERGEQSGWKERTHKGIANMPSKYKEHPSYLKAIAVHGIKPTANAYVAIKAARQAHPSLRAWADKLPAA